MSKRAIGNGQGSRDIDPPAPPSPKPNALQEGNGPFRRVVQIVNPLGLHQRAADRFCRAAKQYESRVAVINGDRRADGKNIWDLIGLLVFPGMEVVLEIEGSDAAAAIDPLAQVLGAPGGEDYRI
jgi:phosphotransferase system HPr (HPr) family protein